MRFMPTDVICYWSLTAMALVSAGPLMAGQVKAQDFIDVEGGRATLYVSSSGQSMLLDTGYDGFEGLDATRIAAAAARAGVRQIDYLVTTHYYGDHVGRVTEVAARLAIRNSSITGRPPSAPSARHRTRPTCAVTKTGPRKAVVGPILQTLRASPGLEDLWQLQYSLLGNQENVPEEFIANVGNVDRGYGLQLSARADGRFAIANARTGQTTASAAR